MSDRRDSIALFAQQSYLVQEALRIPVEVRAADEPVARARLGVHLLWVSVAKAVDAAGVARRVLRLSQFRYRYPDRLPVARYRIALFVTSTRSARPPRFSYNTVPMSHSISEALVDYRFC